MNTSSRSLFAVAVFAISLSACHQADPPFVTQEWKGDPSVPDATTVFAKRDAEAKAMQDSAAPQASSVTPKEKDMSKAQESKAMPLPGQANDHSNVALDKNKGG